jgi:hypothetical protein
MAQLALQQRFFNKTIRNHRTNIALTSRKTDNSESAQPSTESKSLDACFPYLSLHNNCRLSNHSRRENQKPKQFSTDLDPKVPCPEVSVGIGNAFVSPGAAGSRRATAGALNERRNHPPGGGDLENPQLSIAVMASHFRKQTSE